MANPKFKINIEGDNSAIFVGDHAKIDIDTTYPRNPRGNDKVSNNIVYKGHGKSQHLPQAERLGTGYQETGFKGNSEMDCKIQQGFALIIHNKVFHKRPDPERSGSEKDMEAIRDFCNSYGLRINDTSRSTEDLTATEIDNLCSEISQRDFSRYDSFVCFILSHGTEGSIYGIDENTIAIEKIISKFKDVPGLIGKPKLFFIQACRGRSSDDGLDADSHPIYDPDSRLRLPRESDILLVHSSVLGYESYRSREHGSWFIITLIEQLNLHAHHMHLMDILTLVNRKIAGYKTPNGKKQMSCQLSTLTKFIFFCNKLQSTTN